MDDTPRQTESATDHLALQIGERQYALERDRTFLIGQSEECDIKLRHQSIGAHHARLRLRGNLVLLEDLSTENGTFVGGERIHSHLLTRGDLAVLGQIPVMIVADTGDALIVPDPVMMTAARLARSETAPATEPPVTQPPVAPPALPPHPALVTDATEPLPPAVEPSPTTTRDHWIETHPKTRRSAADLPLRRSDEATFTDVMADELRRAPWLTLSLVLHATLLLLLYLYTQPDPAGGMRLPDIGLMGYDGERDLQAPAAGMEKVNVEESDPAELLDEKFDKDAFELEVEFTEETNPDENRTLMGNPIVVSKRSSVPRGEDVLDAGGAGLDTGGFVDQVSELRKSGLEIVFVFDSTNSMSRVIDTTKESIGRMLEVLQALVPDAGVGIVTYRDHGQREEYITRHVPLSQDFYRAANFMEVVEARGGGDRPEAVRDALHLAFQQSWRPGARRVVVLVGDAPPHSYEMDKLMADVARFGRARSSQVNTVVTSSHGSNRPDPETRRTFQEIAQQGKGTCVELGAEDELTQRVLSLAFGRKYERNIAEVYRIVEQRRSTISSRTKDLVRRGGSPLIAALSELPVSDELVQALIKKPRRSVLLGLVKALTNKSFPEHGRQAVSYALQRILTLPGPPLDPVEGGRLPPRDRRTLDQMVAQRIRQ